MKRLIVLTRLFFALWSLGSSVGESLIAKHCSWCLTLASLPLQQRSKSE